MLPRLCGLEQVGWRHQMYRIAKRFEFPRSMVSRGTSLNANQTWRQLLKKECQNITTPQLPADNHFATITNPVHHIVERKMRCASQQNRYPMTDMGLGRVKTKSNLVVALSGEGIFAFFCSERDHKPQNSGCGYTA